MSNTTGVAPVIQCLYPELDVSQLEIIGSVDGHVLAIAGPGAVKTLCMALRAVNILLQGLARPEEVCCAPTTGTPPRSCRSGSKTPPVRLVTKAIPGGCASVLYTALWTAAGGAPGASGPQAKLPPAGRTPAVEPAAPEVRRSFRARPTGAEAPGLERRAQRDM